MEFCKWEFIFWRSEYRGVLSCAGLTWMNSIVCTHKRKILLGQLILCAIPLGDHKPVGSMMATCFSSHTCLTVYIACGVCGMLCWASLWCVQVYLCVSVHGPQTHAICFTCCSVKQTAVSFNTARKADCWTYWAMLYWSHMRHGKMAMVQ
jgi:hypothetical protein